MIGQLADVAQIVGHPVHQRVARGGGSLRGAWAKANRPLPSVKDGHPLDRARVRLRVGPRRRRTALSCAGLAPPGTLRRGRSAGCCRPGVHRAGLDGPGAALLRRDERLHAARGRATCPGPRSRRRASWSARSSPSASASLRGSSLRRDRPRRHLAAERLRHPCRHRLVLRARLQPDRRRRRRHPRAPPRRSSSRCSRDRCWESGSDARLWLALALAFAGIVALLQPAFALAWPVVLVATLGALFYAHGDDLAPPHRPRREPRGGGPPLLARRARHHARSSRCRPGAGPMRRARSTSSGAGLGGGGAQLAMTRAYALQRAAPVSALSSLGVVFTYLLALPLFPEHPTAWQVAGSLLVILATGGRYLSGMTAIPLAPRGLGYDPDAGVPPPARGRPRPRRVMERVGGVHLAPRADAEPLRRAGPGDRLPAALRHAPPPRSSAGCTRSIAPRRSLTARDILDTAARAPARRRALDREDGRLARSRRADAGRHRAVAWPRLGG